MAARRQDLLAALAPIAKSLRRIEDAAAHRCGLSMWQYAILAVLAETPGLNQSEVAALLDYSPNRIIADLDLLQDSELLVRRPGADRRSNVLSITPDGRRLMQRVRADIHHGEDELLATLPADQRRALRTIAGAR